MQDENLLKMSQIATPPLMDTHMANILICCLHGTAGQAGFPDTTV